MPNEKDAHGMQQCHLLTIEQNNEWPNHIFVHINGFSGINHLGRHIED